MAAVLKRLLLEDLAGRLKTGAPFDIWLDAARLPDPPHSFANGRKRLEALRAFLDSRGPDRVRECGLRNLTALWDLTKGTDRAIRRRQIPVNAIVSVAIDSFLEDSIAEVARRLPVVIQHQAQADFLPPVRKGPIILKLRDDYVWHRKDVVSSAVTHASTWIGPFVKAKRVVVAANEDNGVITTKFTDEIFVLGSEEFAMGLLPNLSSGARLYVTRASFTDLTFALDLFDFAALRERESGAFGWLKAWLGNVLERAVVDCDISVVSIARRAIAEAEGFMDCEADDANEECLASIKERLGAMQQCFEWSSKDATQLTPEHWEEWARAEFIRGDDEERCHAILCRGIELRPSADLVRRAIRLVKEWRTDPLDAVTRGFVRKIYSRVSELLASDAALACEYVCWAMEDADAVDEVWQLLTVGGPWTESQQQLLRQAVLNSPRCREVRGKRISCGKWSLQWNEAGTGAKRAADVVAELLSKWVPELSDAEVGANLQCVGLLSRSKGDELQTLFDGSHVVELGDLWSMALGPADPWGKLFVSYRRSAADLCDKAVRTLREHGIPTWLDRSDVHIGEPAYGKINGQLRDKSTAGALLLVTSDYATRADKLDYVLDLELPLCAKRMADPVFLVVPVAAAGVTLKTLREHLEGVQNADMIADRGGLEIGAEATEAELVQVARLVLARRLASAEREYPPLRLCVTTDRTQPVGRDCISLDWSALRESTVAGTDGCGTWERLAHATLAVFDEIAKSSPSSRLLRLSATDCGCAALVGFECGLRSLCLRVNVAQPEDWWGVEGDETPLQTASLDSDGVRRGAKNRLAVFVGEGTWGEREQKVLDKQSPRGLVQLFLGDSDSSPAQVRWCIGKLIATAGAVADSMPTTPEGVDLFLRVRAPVAALAAAALSSLRLPTIVYLSDPVAGYRCGPSLRPETARFHSDK